MRCGNPTTLTNWNRVIRNETASVWPIALIFYGSALLVCAALSRCNVSRAQNALILCAVSAIPTAAIEHEISKTLPTFWSDLAHTIIATTSGLFFFLFVVSCVGELLLQKSMVLFLVVAMTCSGAVCIASTFYYVWTLTASTEYVCILLAGFLVFEIARIKEGEVKQVSFRSGSTGGVN